MFDVLHIAPLECPRVRNPLVSFNFGAHYGLPFFLHGGKGKCCMWLVKKCNSNKGTANKFWILGTYWPSLPFTSVGRPPREDGPEQTAETANKFGLKVRPLIGRTDASSGTAISVSERASQQT